MVHYNVPELTITRGVAPTIWQETLAVVALSNDKLLETRPYARGEQLAREAQSDHSKDH